MISYKTREGNGTPLQYSCLENPTNGGAWWAAVYGVAQSRTRLKRLTAAAAAAAVQLQVPKVVCCSGTVGRPGACPEHNLAQWFYRPTSARMDEICRYSQQWALCTHACIHTHTHTHTRYLGEVNSSNWLRLLCVCY